MTTKKINFEEERSYIEQISILFPIEMQPKKTANRISEFMFRYTKIHTSEKL